MTREDTERLFSMHGRSIYFFCLHLCGRREQGEELFQDTVLKTLEVADRIRSDDELMQARNYCMGIAVRLYRYRRRKEAAHPVLSLDDDTSGIGYRISSNLTPEEVLVRQQEMQALRNAVRTLPEKLREVVYLFYYAELPLKDIAETLEIPEGTVKSRLNTAKKRLRKLLEEK